MKDVTAILTVYKRPEYLSKQIDAMLSQTFKISNYIICLNGSENRKKVDKVIHHKWIADKTLIVEFNKNQWVWNRFFLAYNAKTEYIFVCDDDIIPWNKWIENCVNQSDWIIGSWWSVFNSLETRWDRYVVCETEWNNCIRPKELTQVDMSWHSWFFKKELLWKMFNELPKVDYPTCWEELWVSLNIPTYILPMTDDIETRWNKEPRLWLDSVANFRTEASKYQEFYSYCILNWFIPLKFRLYD